MQEINKGKTKDTDLFCFPSPSMSFNTAFYERLDIGAGHISDDIDVFASEADICISRKDIVALISNQYTWSTVLQLYMRRYVFNMCHAADDRVFIELILPSPVL
jgi:hypothetical protein